MSVNPHKHNEVIQNLRKPRGKKLDTVPVLPEIKEETQMIKSLEPEDEFDLDSELDKLAANMQTQEEPEQPPSQEETMRDQLLSILRNHKEAPSQEQIDAWKRKFGENGVQLIAFDPDTAYIYTHLTLGQWEKIQRLGQQGGPDIEKAMKDAVLRTAILWPKVSPEYFQGVRAGLHSTLFELILVNSYFLSPQQAITLTTKL